MWTSAKEPCVLCVIYILYSYCLIIRYQLQPESKNQCNRVHIQCFSIIRFDSEWHTIWRLLCICDAQWHHPYSTSFMEPERKRGGGEVYLFQFKEAAPSFGRWAVPGLNSNQWNESDYAWVFMFWLSESVYINPPKWLRASLHARPVGKFIR